MPQIKSKGQHFERHVHTTSMQSARSQAAAEPIASACGRANEALTCARARGRLRLPRHRTPRTRARAPQSGSVNAAAVATVVAAAAAIERSKPAIIENEASRRSFNGGDTDQSRLYKR